MSNRNRSSFSFALAFWRTDVLPKTLIWNRFIRELNVATSKVTNSQQLLNDIELSIKDKSSVSEKKHLLTARRLKRNARERESIKKGVAQRHSSVWQPSGFTKPPLLENIFGVPNFNTFPKTKKSSPLFNFRKWENFAFAHLVGDIYPSYEN
jgi:hypothetical protein